MNEKDTLKLNETIERLEMLLKLNKSIIDQLCVINGEYEKIINKLEKHIDQEVKSDQYIELAIKEECELSDTKLEVVMEQHVEEPMQQEPIQEEPMQEEPIQTTLGDFIAEDIAGVTGYMNDLMQHIKEMHTEDQIIYKRFIAINKQYNNFLQLYFQQFMDDSVEDTNRRVADVLVRHLGEYEWVNNTLKIYAYSRTEKFKFGTSRDLIKDLHDEIVGLYKKYGITLDIPKLLQDKYESVKHEYNNDNNTVIEKYCDVTLAEYPNKVYDLIRVGYSWNDGAELKVCKPVIYYI